MNHGTLSMDRVSLYYSIGENLAPFQDGESESGEVEVVHGHGTRPAGEEDVQARLAGAVDAVGGRVVMGRRSVVGGRSGARGRAVGGYVVG